MGYFYEIDFTVTLSAGTSANETLEHSLSAGQLYVANSNVEPVSGTRFYKTYLEVSGSESPWLGGKYEDFIDDDLSAAKGSPTYAGDIYEVGDNRTITYITRHTDGNNGLVVLKSDRRVLAPNGPMGGPNSSPDFEYQGNRTLSLPSSDLYSLSALTIIKGVGSGGFTFNWFVCVNDSDSALLESETTLPTIEDYAWSGRSGVNDIPIWTGGETSSTIVFADHGITNNVTGQEIVIRAAGTDAATSAIFTYYTGNPRRNPWYTTGGGPTFWSSSAYNADGVSRMLITSAGEFDYEDWNDGDYNDYVGSQGYPPFDPVELGTLFYVNANGSNIYPWNTPSKGFTSFSALSAGLGGILEDGYTIEVVNDGEIDDSGENITLVMNESGTVTIRSYGTDGTNRVTSKPTIKVKNSGYGIYIDSDYDFTCNVENLKIYKDESQGSLAGYIFSIYCGNKSVSGCISGCMIWCNVTGASANLARGITIDGYGYCSITNNVVAKVYNGISQTQSITPVSASTEYYNNTVFDFANIGINALQDRTAKIYNNIIDGNNRSGGFSWGVYYTSGYGVSEDYNDFWRCTSAAVAEGYNVSTNIGTSSFSADPIFFDTANDDFRIWTNSPCIDTGLSGLVLTDYRGTSRPQVIPGYTPTTDGTDIGAYEMLETELKGGHIGAFYFGPIVQNITAPISTITVSSFLPEVTITDPVSVTITAPISTIWITPLGSTVFTTSDIKIDFVGVPRIGTSPLVVDFTATVTFGGAYFNKYKVKEYIWYFDYGNYPTVTETTTSPTITHIYNGYSGQKFDVRCCVTIESV